MQCERCGQREATILITRVFDDTAAPTIGLCEGCAAVPAPPDFDHARAAIAVETQRSDIVEPAVFQTMADELAQRARLHGVTLPPEIQAFVDRHASRPVT
jgi:protein-arginine kinase activator protein McsA